LKKNKREDIIGRNNVEVMTEMGFTDTTNDICEFLEFVDSKGCSVCTKCNTIVDIHEITTDDFHGCKRCLL